MSRFIDQPDAIVTDALTGLQRSGRLHNVVQLDGFPDIKVVMRDDHDRNKVAVISGGGSGHEPAHAGFVGQGMLTAAVAGELFASPSVDAVLAAILATTGEGGCLLIVKNYTGDRLNFGLAAERAKARGLAVAMVIIADDIALPDTPQPRGLAGTLLAHKVAGYHAERGASLAEVKQAVDALANHMGSIGLALQTCDLLTQPPRAEDSAPELGLGIHGEPGAQRVEVPDASTAVRLMTQRLLEHCPGDTPLVLLVNNLGGVTPIEMDILTRAILDSELGARCTLLVGPDTLLSSLNMYGLSITAAVLDDDIYNALEASVGPRAWPGISVPVDPHYVPLPDMPNESDWPAQSDEAIEAVIRCIGGALIESRAVLDRMDSHVGDGDTGSTVAHGAETVIKALDTQGLPLATPSELMQALGTLVGRGMGGSSGALLSTFFSAAGGALADDAPLGESLLSGLEAVKTYGGARVGDRTMLDALEPALQAFSDSGSVTAAAEAARQGAESTQQLEQAGAGRSAYLRADSLRGHTDPGAEAVAIAFESLACDE